MERFPARIMTRLLALCLVAVATAACGSDAGPTTPTPTPPSPPAPVAPVAVGSIPAQVMTAGQTVTVDVTPFFRDPDGGVLTYTGASSDPALVSVSLSGSNMTVTAVAAGTATVTVTATDPDGLSATQSATITVEAANQAPEAVGTIPPQTMTVGQAETVDVSSFFSDPDGDELTYSAASSNPAVATAGMSGSSLTVTAVAAGTATVTVMARDPGGLTAEQSADVTVSEGSGGEGFRDDFTSSASLSDWETVDARAAISNGMMRVTNVVDGPGRAFQEFGYTLTSWTLRVRLGRAQDEGFASAWWFTGHSQYPWFAFDIGTDSAGDNYSLWVWDAEAEAWLWLSDASGNSAAINESPHELTEITIGWDDGEFLGLAGETELFRVQPSSEFAALLEGVGGVGLVMEYFAGRTALFDWVEVTGVESSAAMPDAPLGATPGVGALSLPQETSGVSKANHGKSDTLGGASVRRKNR